MAYRLDHDSLKDVAEQMMSGAVVSIGKKSIKVEDRVAEISDGSL